MIPSALQEVGLGIMAWADCEYTTFSESVGLLVYFSFIDVLTIILSGIRNAIHAVHAIYKYNPRKLLNAKIRKDISQAPT